MKTKDRSLPYPVLSPARDDVQPNTFSATLTPASDPQNYYLHFRFELPNPTLESLIADGKAIYSVQVECRSNFYRDLYGYSTPEGRITIPADDLAGTVEVSFFVTARSNIPDYTIAGSHPDYAGATFAIRPGDVLAIAPAVTFDADKDYDPLKKISSILQVCPADDLLDGPFAIDFSNQKLTVFLAKHDYENYAQLRAAPRVTACLVHGIVVPVLVEAINYMRQSPKEEAESESLPRWFRILKQRLAEVDENYANTAKLSLELAQKLLRNPLNRCFQELLQLTEGEDRQ